MASTRNKNTSINYNLEVRNNNAQKHYTFTQTQTHFPKLAGNGLIQGRMPNTLLSANTIDIDSFLKGIHLTDLTHKPNHNGVTYSLTPELNHLPEYNLYNKTATLLPENFSPEQNQRPNLS